jgi:putative ABC transport system ATP-binding protein
MPFCEFHDVSRLYRKGDREFFALREVTYAFSAGDFLAVTGPSGSGKSTFLNILGLLDRPTRGTYLHLGEDVSNLDDDALSRIRNRTIGFIFQSFNLFPQLTALENVEVPMLYAGVPAGERHRRASELVERVGLAKRALHRPTELSGGECQRTAIARALTNKPSLILADEPTGNLDETNGNEIVKLLIELNAQGTALVIVTHNPEVAAQARQQVRLHDGRLEP